MASRRRGSSSSTKWSEHEEVALCQAWIRHSEDCITGDQQKVDGFYTNVKALWEIFAGDNRNVSRSVKSVKDHWTTIKKACMKWSNAEREAARQVRSGMGIEDVFGLARTNYERDEGGSFKYMHCWNFLKDKKKFMDVCDPAGPEQTSSQPGAESVPPPWDSTEQFSAPPSTRHPWRPMGTQSAKRGKHKASTSVADRSDELIEQIRVYNECQKDALKLAIMGMSPSKVGGPRGEWLRAQQEQILSDWQQTPSTNSPRGSASGAEPSTPSSAASQPAMTSNFGDNRAQVWDVSPFDAFMPPNVPDDMPRRSK